MSVVQLHYPGDSRFSLTFITDEKTERIRKAQTLSEDIDIEVAIRVETIPASDTDADLDTTTTDNRVHIAIEGIDDEIR